MTEEELLEVQTAGEEFTTDDIMDSGTLEDRLQEEGAPTEGKVVVEDTDPNNAALSRILAAADNFKDTLVHSDMCVMCRE